MANQLDEWSCISAIINEFVGHIQYDKSHLVIISFDDYVITLTQKSYPIDPTDINKIYKNGGTLITTKGFPKSIYLVGSTKKLIKKYNQNNLFNNI